ncbi:MAG: hypothetical protein KatS3mg025_0122 [Bacteroidia bacterium]|nr:MAG: hypothetical protein KatS3mg025_0122 [Bacteroidia bacterium]
MKELPILPSHWLFNASMIGLLEVFASQGISPEDFLREEGTLAGKRLLRRVFSALSEPAFDSTHELWPLRQLHWWFVQHHAHHAGKIPPPPNPKCPFRTEEGKIFYAALASLFGNKAPYQNWYHHSEGKWANPSQFAETFSWETVFTPKKRRRESCLFLGETRYVTQPIDLRNLQWLFPAQSSFPNAFRGLHEEGTLRLSRPALTAILFHHLAFTRLSDNSEVFINAPSFKLMWHLNRLLKGISEQQEALPLLATSVVEYSLRIQRMLGGWVFQNIQLIHRQGETVETVTLSPAVVRLLLRPKVTQALARLRSSALVRALLAGRFGIVQHLSYLALRSQLLKNSKEAALKHFFKDIPYERLPFITQNLLILATEIRTIQKSHSLWI